MTDSEASPVAELRRRMTLIETRQDLIDSIAGPSIRQMIGLLERRGRPFPLVRLDPATAPPPIYG